MRGIGGCGQRRRISATVSAIEPVVEVPGALLSAVVDGRGPEKGSPTCAKWPPLTNARPGTFGGMALALARSMAESKLSASRSSIRVPKVPAILARR